MVRRALIILLGWLASGWAPASIASSPDVSAELARLAPIRGPAISPAALEGQVVLVTFFASWCPPCREEFAHLIPVQEAYRDAGLTVVAINVFETWDDLSTPAKLAHFLDVTTPNFAILKGDRETRRAFFDLDRIPSLFLFGRDSRLAMVFKHERGATKTLLNETELRAAIEPLL